MRKKFFKTLYRVQIICKYYFDGSDEEYFTNIFTYPDDAQLFVSLLPNEDQKIPNIIQYIFPDTFTEKIDEKIIENNWNSEQDAINWFRKAIKSDYSDEILYEILRFRVLSKKYGMIGNTLYIKRIDELKMFRDDDV